MDCDYPRVRLGQESFCRLAKLSSNTAHKYNPDGTQPGRVLIKLINQLSQFYVEAVFFEEAHKCKIEGDGRMEKALSMVEEVMSVSLARILIFYT